MRAVFETTPSPTGHGVWWKAEVAGGDFVMSGAPTIERAVSDARQHCDERGWTFDAPAQADEPETKRRVPSATQVREQLVATLNAEGPGTSRELAERMGVSVDAMKRRVERALAAGIIVVVGRKVGHRGGPRNVLGLPGQRVPLEAVEVETPATPREMTTEERRIAALKRDVRGIVAQGPIGPRAVALALLRNQGEVRQLMLEDEVRGRMRRLPDGRYEVAA